MTESAILGFSEFTRESGVGTGEVVRSQDQGSHQGEIGLRAAQQYGGPELPLPDWARVRAELSRRGVTLQLLWREYRSKHPGGYGYSQFCELYGPQEEGSRADDAPDAPGRRRLLRLRGRDDAGGRSRDRSVARGQIFVYALGASNYIYAEA